MQSFMGFDSLISFWTGDIILISCSSFGGVCNNAITLLHVLNRQVTCSGRGQLACSGICRALQLPAATFSAAAANVNYTVR